MVIRFERTSTPLPHFDLRLDLETNSSRVAIVGPSGAGKSTMLDLIAGVRLPAEGRIHIDGRVCADGSSHRVPIQDRGVGYVPQDHALFTHLSVLRNALFSPRADRSRIASIAAALDLEPLLQRKTAQLSGGEKRRVSIARALLSAPRLLLLDEPFSGLDAARRAAVIELVRDSALPYVLVTHDRREAESLCDEVIELDRGEIVSQK